MLTAYHREDTPGAFRNFSEFWGASHKAKIPRGYNLTIEGMDGSIDMGLGYLGVQYLEEYDSVRCATFCNDLPTCGSVNLYFERLPLQDPSIKGGCPNPPSTTHIKCVLWRSELTQDSAVNIGERRAGFDVVIAGSNGYSKQAGVLAVPNFYGPNDVDNHAAFDVPLEPTDGFNTHLSHNVYPFESARQAWMANQSNSTILPRRAAQQFIADYNVSMCADKCNRWTEGGLQVPQDANPYVDDAFPVCSMFVAYQLQSNDVPMAMVCDTFSSVWSTHYQTLRKTENGMAISRVSVYAREDYQYPAICAEKDYCKGGSYYPGGDCSGWGPGRCAPAEDEPLLLKRSEMDPMDAPSSHLGAGMGLLFGGLVIACMGAYWARRRRVRS